MPKDRDLNITSEVTQPKGFDEIPNPGKSKIPNELKPVKPEPLPEIKISFGEKIGRIFKGIEDVITKIFTTMQQIPAAVKDFKYGMILFVIAIVIIAVLYIVVKK